MRCPSWLYRGEFVVYAAGKKLLQDTLYADGWDVR